MLNLVKNIDKKLKLKRRAISGLASIHAFGHPSKHMQVVGVTGTNGKTTVSTLLYKVARELGYNAGLIGTVEVLINDKRYEFEHKIPTTPDPLTLNQILKAMKKAKVELG
jgi:UDP-N-acetylmuramoyl-L-alanyl-D-glutamate--2,6-diaminopimelate ligase